MKARGDYKYCASCKDFKSIECFGKDRYQGDGLHIYCKACRSKAKKSKHTNFQPETVYSVGTDYVSRGCVPLAQRQLFDELIEIGGVVWIENMSGQRTAWEDVD